MPKIGQQRTSTERWMALGGIAGPVAFVAAWSALGTRQAGYSHIHDPISELAAIDAPSRPLMTAGFIAFAAGISFFAIPLRPVMSGRAAAAAGLCALATLGIAAFPLGSELGDGPHGAAAGLAYAALAAMPLLGSRWHAAAGRRGAAFASVAAGVTTGAALVLSAATSSRTGLAQRVGLTVGDVWIVVTAMTMLRHKRGR